MKKMKLKYEVRCREFPLHVGPTPQHGTDYSIDCLFCEDIQS